MYNKFDEFCGRIYSWVYSFFTTKVPAPVSPGTWEWIATGVGEGKTTRLVDWVTQKAKSGDVLWLSITHQRSDWVSKHHVMPHNVDLWPISRLTEALSGKQYVAIAVDDFDELTTCVKEQVDELLESRRRLGVDICCTITKNRTFRKDSHGNPVS